MFLSGKVVEALDIFRSKDIHNDPLSLYRLGRIYFELNELDNSINQFKLSIDLDPSQFEPFSYLGFVYLKMNKIKEAKEFFEQSIKKNISKNSIAILHYGNLLMEESCLEKAIAMFSDYLQFNPRSSKILRNLAVAYYKMKNTQDCISTIHLCLRIDFRDPEAWELLGECYFIDGRYHSGLKALERAIEIDPTLPYANLYIALIKDKLQDFSDATSRLVSLIGNPTVGNMALLYLLDVYLDVFHDHINSKCFGIAFDKLSECIDIIKNCADNRFLTTHYGLWRFLSKVVFYSLQVPSIFSC